MFDSDLLFGRWYRGELRTALQARTPKYITKEELVIVVSFHTSDAPDTMYQVIRARFQVKWKLTRGTWRPKLVKYADLAGVE